MEAEVVAVVVVSRNISPTTENPVMSQGVHPSCFFTSCTFQAQSWGLPAGASGLRLKVRGVVTYRGAVGNTGI